MNKRQKFAWKLVAICGFILFFTGGQELTIRRGLLYGLSLAGIWFLFKLVEQFLGKEKFERELEMAFPKKLSVRRVLWVSFWTVLIASILIWVGLRP